METAATASEDAAIADDEDDDDAMDICTTPPPNEHEDLTAAIFQTNDSHAAECISSQPQPPPAPKWTDDETTKGNIEKPLDDELASFYSDINEITKLQPETTNEENSCDKSPINTDATNSPEHPADAAAAMAAAAAAAGVADTTALDDKKKKKKKKSKKLEPWRSGNLETWINKWQKAQKELDG